MKKKSYIQHCLPCCWLHARNKNLLNNRLPLQGGRKFSFRLMSLLVNC